MVKYASAASHVFTARSQMHLAQEQLAKEELGVALARIQDAQAAFAAASHAAAGDSAVGGWIASVQAPLGRIQADAQNKNDTVYFARVVKNLPPPDALGRSMAKVVLPDRLMAWPAEEPNPFKEIVPVYVSKVASDYRMKMNTELLEASEWVQEHRDRIRKAISHIGITAVIQQAEGGDQQSGRVPDSLRKKIIALRTDSNGDTFKLMDTLVNMLGHVANSISAAEIAICKIERELAQEVQQDHQYLQMYGEKVWYSLRQPSSKLPDYQSLQKIIVELRGSVDATLKEPNDKLKQVLQDNLRELSRLDWPMDDLDALMPYSKTKAARQLSSQVKLSVEELKGAMDRFDNLETDETTALKELAASLTSEHLTEALAAVAPERHDEVLDRLTAEFNGQVTALRGIVACSDSLLEECQELMLSLAEVKSDDPIADEVQKVSSGLEGACSLYQSLHRQIGDVSGTAAGLMDRAESSQSLAQSYALGRSVEADDFRTSLDQQLAQKMKEVEMQRTSSQEVIASKQRQEDLQQQIAALERERAMKQQSSQPQPPHVGGDTHGGQGQGHVLDHMAQQQQTSAMDALFGGGGGAPQPTPYSGSATTPSSSSTNAGNQMPYVYNPAPPPPQPQQPAMSGAPGSYLPPPHPQQQQQQFYGNPPQHQQQSYGNPPQHHQQQQPQQQAYAYPQQQQQQQYGQQQQHQYQPQNPQYSQQQAQWQQPPPQPQAQNPPPPAYTPPFGPPQ